MLQVQLVTIPARSGILESGALNLLIAAGSRRALSRRGGTSAGLWRSGEPDAVPARPEPNTVVSIVLSASMIRSVRRMGAGFVGELQEPCRARHRTRGAGIENSAGIGCRGDATAAKTGREPANANAFGKKSAPCATVPTRCPCGLRPCAINPSAP